MSTKLTFQAKCLKKVIESIIDFVSMELEDTSGSIFIKCYIY